MNAAWKRDGEGDYTLALPSGETAWVAKGASSHSHPPWYGKAFKPNGESARISAWSLASAKSFAERYLQA